MNTQTAFELADFIVPIAFAATAFLFTITYAVVALVKIALSGESFTTTTEEPTTISMSLAA